MSPLPALLILFCLPLHAELTVVADLGGESAAPWYDPISPQPDVAVLPAPLKPVDKSHWLPVISHRLTPGPVTTREVQLPGMQPLFLVGDDPISYRWLDANRQQLMTLKAIGIVVNVSNVDALNNLRERIPDLMMVPEPGDDLASRLNISHYPVLITSSQISQ